MYRKGKLRFLPYFFVFISILFGIWLDIYWTDISILQMKSIDEYAFHGILLKMHDGLVSLDIKKIFSFNFFSYGFSFFALNEIAAFPWLGESGTSIAIIIPRLITTLLMGITLLILIKFLEQLHSDGFEKTLTLLIVIVMPGIWFNATLFNPDFMMVMLLMMSMYMLSRMGNIGDRYYWFAILFWSIAIAVKFQAITFAPVLIWSVIVMVRNKLAPDNYIKVLVASFIAIVMCFIILNPYILHPRGANAWFQSLIINIESNATNHGIVGDLSLMFKIKNAIEPFYMPMASFLLILFLSIVVLCQEWRYKQLRLYSMVAAYILPNIIYLLFFVNKAWNKYYLPIFIMSPLIIVYGINLLKDRFSIKILYVRIIYILFAVSQIVFFFTTLKNIVELRMNGGAIYASIPRYTKQLVYEEQEKDRENEVYELIKEHVTPDAQLLISPYLPFPFKDTGMSYGQVHVIYGPLSPEKFDRRISKFGTIHEEKTYILIKKDDIYFDDKKIGLMIENDAYTSAKNLIQRWISGVGLYQVINQSDCCYLFERKTNKIF